MGVWVCFVQFYDGRVREMVIVRMRDHHEVNDRKVFDVAGWWRVSLWSHEGERATTVFEHGVEEDTQP